MKKRLIMQACSLLVFSFSMNGQQVPDTAYNPEITRPAYQKGRGPVIFIDEGHNNFHTRGERYLPFALLLKRDGYRTESYTGSFEAGKLNKVRILVISNALNKANVENWYKPVLPAFTAEETETVRNWVKAGGSLFLIADHMPMGGAAAGMAKAFGFEFTDGFALDTARPGPSLFCRAAGTLKDNVITDGRDKAERVDTIFSFTGQAFPAPGGTTPVLCLDDHYRLLLTDTAWVFDKNTRYRDITGWSQLAYMPYGKGRVVMSGEAAMFSAQLAGPQRYPAGMNAPYARENYKLLLNIIHWLDGILK